MEKKILTVGVPAYKAENHICDALASIQIQTVKDNISIIIASDNPNDSYDFVKQRFPDLDIKILSCEKNGGPGVVGESRYCATEDEALRAMQQYGRSVVKSPWSSSGRGVRLRRRV